MKINKYLAKNFNISNLIQYTIELYNSDREELVDGIPLHVRKIWLLQRKTGLYNLLAYISTLINNTNIIELGTKFGLSALCLSYNSLNNIISYDIEDQGQFLIEKSNLEFRIQNILNDNDISILLNTSIIFIDIAPHDGIQEQYILDFLTQNNYKGITIWDDIYYGSPENGNELIKFWKNISLPKHDLSDCYDLDCNLGVGIVDFSNEIEIY